MELALKPVYSCAAKNVCHLRLNTPLLAKVEVGPGNEYVAQELITGNRYCSYCVLLDGRIFVFSVHPVFDTTDGASCVYFQSIGHASIRAYVDPIADALPGVNGQIAFDFIKTDNQLVAIECNPRATSGIYLWSGTPDLATRLHGLRLRWPSRAPGDSLFLGCSCGRESVGGSREYLRHMKRLMGTKDVTFSGKDLLPSLMQPFLLTSYYEIYRERKMNISTMLQWDLVWEPDREQLESVRRLLAREGRGATGWRGAKRDVEREERSSLGKDSGFGVGRNV